jgi:hypothetical protein
MHRKSLPPSPSVTQQLHHTGKSSTLTHAQKRRSAPKKKKRASEKGEERSKTVCFILRITRHNREERFHKAHEEKKNVRRHKRYGLNTAKENYLMYFSTRHFHDRERRN